MNPEPLHLKRGVVLIAKILDQLVIVLLAILVSTYTYALNYASDISVLRELNCCQLNGLVLLTFHVFMVNK